MKSRVNIVMSIIIGCEVLVILFLFWLLFNSNHLTKDLVGSYQYEKNDNSTYFIINLNSDMTFNYEENSVKNGVVGKKEVKGLWEVHGDTLYLNMPNAKYQTFNIDAKNEILEYVCRDSVGFEYIDVQNMEKFLKYS